MIDRASTFSDPRIITSLKEKFVPVAINQAYHRRQRDNEGEFYRRIVRQGPRGNVPGTTQGLYVASATGKLLGYTNHRAPDRVLAMIADALARHQPVVAKPLDPGVLDRQYHPVLPAGGLVVRVQGRVLGGYPEPTRDYERIFQSALSRDNLWIRPDEVQSLVDGVFPMSLAMRVATAHLVDNTRGESPMWHVAEVRSISISLEDGVVRGTIRLESDDGKREYDAVIFGKVESTAERLRRFDLVASGEFRGEGPWTPGAPPGRFPLAISFTLADGSDVADAVPPEGAHVIGGGYLNNDRR